jgi:hypothetical protein
MEMEGEGRWLRRGGGRRGAGVGIGGRRESTTDETEDSVRNGREWGE